MCCLVIAYGSIYIKITVIVIGVITLTDDNFDELVMSPKSGKWFVKIYAPVFHTKFHIISSGVVIASILLPFGKN